MGYFIWLLGPWIVGFVAGATYSLDFRASVKKNKEAALKALAYCLREGKADVPNVIRLFEDHGHKFADEREGKLYFKVDPASKWTQWETFVAFQGVLLTLITLGGFPVFIGVVYFFGRPNQQVELDLHGLKASL